MIFWVAFAKILNSNLEEKYLFKSKQLLYCDQFFSNSQKRVSTWSIVAVHIAWARPLMEQISAIFFVAEQYASEINWWNWFASRPLDGTLISVNAAESSEVSKQNQPKSREP